jgi:hypothetical protein
MPTANMPTLSLPADAGHTRDFLDVLAAPEHISPPWWCQVREISRMFRSYRLQDLSELASRNNFSTSKEYFASLTPQLAVG